MQDIISTLKNALQQAEAGLEVAVGRLAKNDTERGDFKPSEVLALACVREALAMPVPCLHQIQVPSAAEQAAWHAGLDEGRAQAAPAAVAWSMPAEPTEQMIEVLMAGEDRLRARHGDDLPKQRATNRYHALLALAATPAADAEKPVFVLGSAPTASLPPDIGRYFVIAANGAIATFPDLVPDVLILNGWALVDASGVGPETRAQLRGRSVKRLVVIDNLKPGDKSTASRVQELGIQYEHVEFWSKVERAEICSNASGIQYAGLAGNDIPSTGVTAICYAISLSKDVTVSGISIESDGHSYSSGNYKRGHIEVDGQTLDAIAGKFRALLATATGLPAQADMPDSFREWFAKNYPVDTIIVDPDWHAKSIFRMAQAHARLAAPQAQADARDAEQEVLMEHSGCGSNTQVDMLTVRLNPGDKVVMHKGRITQGFDRANRAAIAAAKGEGQ